MKNILIKMVLIMGIFLQFSLPLKSMNQQINERVKNQLSNLNNLSTENLEALLNDLQSKQINEVVIKCKSVEDQAMVIEHIKELIEKEEGLKLKRYVRGALKVIMLMLVISFTLYNIYLGIDRFNNNDQQECFTVREHEGTGQYGIFGVNPFGK